MRLSARQRARAGVSGTTDVLKDAHLAVMHGGLGGIKEAIVASIPSLIIPFAFDQEPNGLRVRHHGLGAVCPASDATPQRIRDIAARIMDDPATAMKCRNMAQIFLEHERRSPARHLVVDATRAAH